MFDLNNNNYYLLEDVHSKVNPNASVGRPHTSRRPSWPSGTELPLALRGFRRPWPYEDCCACIKRNIINNV